MKELIKQNEFGISVLNKDKSVRVDSRYIAEVFDKLHKNVLQSIDNLLKSQGLSDNFKRLNFQPIKYTDIRGRKCKAYSLTRDGFSLLVMGFTGDTALKFKEWYINRFNEMEERLQSLLLARYECPELTDALKSLNSDNKFIYSTEFNMINKIVLGMSTKKFREMKGIEKSDSIRPYLSAKEIDYIQKLQKYDSVLVDVVPDYDMRKVALEKHFKKLQGGN